MSLYFIDTSTRYFVQQQHFILLHLGPTLQIAVNNNIDIQNI